MQKLFKPLFLILLLFIGCNDDTIPTTQNQFLLRSELIQSVNSSQIAAIAENLTGLSNIGIAFNLTGVDVYKIIYTTVDVEGFEIIASGALIVPQVNGTLPIISYQHGTITSYDEAPSEYDQGIETTGLATFLASAGYAVAVPDYLGYGESSDYPHPYGHSATLGSASFDMLLAVKEFAKDNFITLNEKLFLTGYSEGGDATMALHRQIEMNSSIPVTLSAPASGAYNKTAFALEIIQRNENLNFLNFYVWVIDTYNWAHNMGRSWTDFVDEPDATILDGVTHPFDYEDAPIDSNPTTLFSQNFIDGVANQADLEFINILAENDTYNWTPQYPIRLYYGTEDDFVFPINSETAFDALTANGANVTRVVFNGEDHSGAFFPYVLDMFFQFESLK